MSDEAMSQFGAALDSVLDYAHARDYRGYGKFDALNSPLVKALSFNTKWLRFAASQAVKVAPINIRPLVGVRPCSNPKGMALFAQSYLRQHQIAENQDAFERARNCLDWLLGDRLREGYTGPCWGYHWDWQDLDFFAPSRSPNCVVTCFVAQALLDGYEATANTDYLEAAAGAVDFIANDLPVLLETDKTRCIAYVPDPHITMRVMDVSVLAGALIARVSALTGDTKHAGAAEKMVRYVVDLQTKAGAWFYTDPPGRSLRTHDNYHTAFILDALATYEDTTGDDAFRPTYLKGLEFYRTRLFLDDGAPKWTDTQSFPQDAHSAGTAIGTLARAHERTGDPGLLELAKSVARWALANLRRSDGAFNYQKTRFCVKRFTLMRWCNGWMAAGLSQLLLTLSRKGA